MPTIPPLELIHGSAVRGASGTLEEVEHYLPGPLGLFQEDPVSTIGFLDNPTQHAKRVADHFRL